MQGLGPAVFAEEEQIFRRVLAARQDDRIGTGQVAGMAGVVQGDVVFPGQAVKIGEIGNLRDLDDGDGYLIGCRPLFLIVEGHGIFFVDAQVVDIRDYAQDGLACLFL